MGLLSWFSNNKVQTEVENINVNGKNVKVNTSHTQWIEEIKIGVEFLLIFGIIVVVAIFIKKLYKWNQHRRVNKRRELQRVILGLNSTRDLTLTNIN